MEIGLAVATRLTRPQRWDRPFDPAMSQDRLAFLMQNPVIDAIDSEAFPKTIPLTEIV
jgi:hypothetical protein